MKRKLMILILLFWGSGIIAQSQPPSFYSLSVSDIDGNSIALSSFQGKKVMVLIAPVTPTDKTLLRDIDSFRTIYGDSIKIIGVPAIEEGFVDSNKAQVKNIYTSRGISIILTNGMYIKKSAQSNQGVLMSWLTNKSQNLHFNTDARGTGHKFLIDKSGSLYAVLPPEIPLLSPLLQSYANKK